MKQTIFSRITLLSLLFLSFDVLACDDTPCESAYLNETKQHIANHVRRAETFRVERHAYSMNRERKAYALYRHIHLTLLGEIPELKTIVVVNNTAKPNFDTANTDTSTKTKSGLKTQPMKVTFTEVVLAKQG